MCNKYSNSQADGSVFVYELSHFFGSPIKHQTRTFLVSLDRENFYRVKASSSKQALGIVMRIGRNPPSPNPPPPPPGSNEENPGTPISPPPPPGKKSISARTTSQSVMLISKDMAYQILKRDSMAKIRRSGIHYKAAKHKTRKYSSATKRRKQGE